MSAAFIVGIGIFIRSKSPLPNTDTSNVVAQQEKVQPVDDQPVADEDSEKPSQPTKPATPSAFVYVIPDKSAITKAQNYTQLDSALDKLLAKYGVTATFKPTGSSTWGSSVTWTVLSQNEFTQAKNYAGWFVDEWYKYPVEFVRKSKLEEINFISKVTVSKQDRAAMPDPYDNELYYGYVTETEDYLRHVIHHEYAHFHEQVNKGTLNWGTSEWIKNNPAGFSYGSGGSSAYDSSTFTWAEHPMPGFVTEYATYGIEEDRADIAGYLLYSKYYIRLKKWITTDSKLASKVSLYKNYLKSVSPQMNADYFEIVN